MTQTHLFVCVNCVDCGMFVTPCPTVRAVGTHIGKSPICLVAGLGVKEVELETRPTDATVGCTGILGQRRICDTNPSVDTCFAKRVGLGIYYVYLCVEIRISHHSHGYLLRKLLIQYIPQKQSSDSRGCALRQRSARGPAFAAMMMMIFRGYQWAQRWAASALICARNHFALDMRSAADQPIAP